MSCSTVKYAEDAGLGTVKLWRRPVKKFGILGLSHGQSASGYGKKITTDFVLRFAGQGHKYRVYCCQFSNVGSLYIVRQSETLYLQTYFADEIEDE